MSPPRSHRSTQRIDLPASSEVLNRKTYAAGERIFAQGDAANYAYIVVSGQVDIWARNGRGQVIHLNTMNSGQVFGEMALMMKAPRSATAIAKTTCELVLVKAQQLQKKLADIDPLMRVWVETLASRIVAATARAE